MERSGMKQAEVVAQFMHDRSSLLKHSSRLVNAGCTLNTVWRIVSSPQAERYHQIATRRIRNAGNAAWILGGRRAIRIEGARHGMTHQYLVKNVLPGMRESRGNVQVRIPILDGQESPLPAKHGIRLDIVAGDRLAWYADQRSFRDGVPTLSIGGGNDFIVEGRSRVLLIVLPYIEMQIDSVRAECGGDHVERGKLGDV